MKLTALILIFLLNGQIYAQVPTTGLQLWLKPETGISLNGKEVTGWKDQSAQQVVLSPSRTPGPSLLENGIQHFPVLHFDGINTGLTTGPLQTFPQKRGTVILLARINGRSRTSGVGLGNLLSTFHGDGTIWQFGASDNKISFYDGKGSEGFAISELATRDWVIISLCRRNDTLIDLYTGGRLDHSFRVENNQPSVNSLKIGYNGRGGGEDGDSIPEVLNGDIAEILMYDRALSAAELTGIHKYISNKYNLELRKAPFHETIWFYGMLLMLLVSTGFAVSKVIGQRRLKKQLDELKREREMDQETQRISREMHDDIGAGLTQIIMMSESAKHKKAETGNRELEDIADTSRRLVNSMSEIIWSLNPENKTLEQLFAYLREQLHKQLEYSGIPYTLDLPEGYGSILLRNEQRRNILLVTKEIVNNAVKYSTASSISVAAKVDGQWISFTVSDNGRGFDRSQVSGGNGLRNIRHRVEELGGTLELITSPGNGCRYIYSIPV
jgi:signal transduction histidine kinase